MGIQPDRSCSLTSGEASSPFMAGTAAPSSALALPLLLAQPAAATKRQLQLFKRCCMLDADCHTPLHHLNVGEPGSVPALTGVSN